MRKTSLFKRSLAGLLTLVLVLGMIPVLDFASAALAAEENSESGVQAQAVEAVNPDHITMPITIRDFAADGMLFEYNETSKTDTQTVVARTPTIAVYLDKTYYQNSLKYDYPYMLKYASGFTSVDVSDFSIWHYIFVNSDGTINRVGKGAEITDTTIPTNGSVIFAHPSAVNYTYLNGITNANKANYTFGSTVEYSQGDTGYYVNSTEYKTFVPNDTKGFGMLYTNETDIHNYIYEWDDVGNLKNSYVAWNDFSMAEEYEGSYLIETEGLYKGFRYYEYTEDVTGEDRTFTHYSPYKYVDLWEVDENGKQINYANQMLVGGTIRTNLMQKYLKDGKPVYTEDAVNWIANYMKLALGISEQNADGSYNTSYVTGDKVADGDTLANKIREQIKKNGNKDGTYGDSYDKFFEEGGLRTYDDIETWYDAAFFLMHNTWRDSSATDDGSDGYGKLAPEYHSMHLIAKEVDGKTTYVFNSMYTDAVYNPTTGEIYNTQIEEFTHATVNDEKKYADGNPQPVDRFDPLGKYGTGLSGTAQTLGYGIASPDTYGDMIEPSTANWADYYDETNYHLSLEGHAQFVYYEADDLYFTFTGDDDVYLYINGIRVLDIGGGHSIAKVSIRLNDVAKVCGLKDGQAYPFDFFYMERHGTAANFGIETNIQLAESSMTTTKTGYQNGSTTGYNGYVDPNTKVAYSFSLENNGNAPIYNLSFDDPAIGVYFGHDKVELNEYSELTELYLYRFNADGTVKSSYFAGNEVATEEETAEQRIVNKIMTELDAALPVGETIAIYGFKYQIPAGAWVDDTFNNTVYSAASSTENGEQDLSGKADWKVRRTNETLNKFHVYDWMAQKISKNPDVKNGWYHPGDYDGVTVTLDEIKKKAGYENDPDAVIVPCNGAGSESEHNLNPNITLNKDANGNVVSLTYKSTIPGVDRMFFKIKNVGKDSLVFNYSIFTYGAVDNIYVLDYGLNVELNGPEFGLLANDHLEVISAPENITVNTVGISETTKTLEAYDEDDSWYVYSPNAEAEKMKTGTIEGTYGNFAFGDKISWKDEKTGESGNYLSLMYQPKEIIDNTDGVVAHIEIREPDYDPQDDLKFYGVDMYEIVTTAPASVMYYEEDFPGITYCTADKGNEWVHYETLDKDGNPVAGEEQSADQESNYGSDPNYEDNKGGVGETDGTAITFTVDTDDANEAQAQLVSQLAKYLGLAGEDSNGTYNKLVVNATEEVMSFIFKGTGFEIVSRTTQDQYAMITVEVYLLDNDGKIMKNQKTDEKYNEYLPATDANGRVRRKTVITESKGGDLYQVPIISFKNLLRAKYEVKVTASYHTEQPRVLYIDGIRIYGPLSDDVALEYYSPDESGANYYEVKNLVASYQAVVAKTVGTVDTGVRLVTGSTLIENTTGSKAVLNNNGITLTDYLSVGPNNELYLSGNDGNNMIAFFLVPNENVPEDQRTVQIGAHRKADSYNEFDGNVGMFYGSTVSALNERTNYHTVASGTEQYFDIDVDKLVKADDMYLVMLAADNGDTYTECLALTNLKVKGYTIQMLKTSLYSANENGTLSEHELVKAVSEVLGVEYGGDGNGNGSGTGEETTPENVNGNLKITIAGLQSNTVASGKVAYLSVTAGTEAETLKVFDAQGNEVKSLVYKRIEEENETGFTFIWRVAGTSGQKQTYTVRVYDAEGLPSVNTMTVTVTVS